MKAIEVIAAVLFWIATAALSVFAWGAGVGFVGWFCVAMVAFMAAALTSEIFA